MKLQTVLRPPALCIQSKYVVTLSAEERLTLTQMVTTGRSSARMIAHAQVLLKADAGPDGPRWTDEPIREAFGLGFTAITRIRRRLVEEGLEAALERRSAPTARLPKLDGRAEAQLVALACSAPPDGRSRWTLQLLTDRLVALAVSEPVSDETVRRVLKKKRAQTVAATDVGAAHRGERGLCGGDGGCAGRV